jgi:hypothetical protein
MLVVGLVLLVILAAAVVVLTKFVMEFRAEVRSLKAARSAAPEPEPVREPVRAAPVVSPPTPAGAEGIPPQILTAIVAAVHFVLGEQHRVVMIHPSESLWSREGRRTIFSSHTFR